MKIVIDMQGCQTESRFRGIGQYTRAFVEALVRNNTEDELFLLCNAKFPEPMEEIRKLFANLLPSGHILAFQFDGDVAEIDLNNAANARMAEKSREEYLDGIAPDWLLLTSLFEGFTDNAVTSIGQFSCPSYRTAVILYDLIPYLNPNPEWPVQYKDYYYRKIESFRRADLCLAISEYARQEALSVFPELREKVMAISSACGRQFCQKEYDDDEKQRMFAKFGITKKYVMSSGTLEPRKNFLQLVVAFSLLPPAVQEEYQLVVVGQGEEGYAKKMRSEARNRGISLLLTGHVDEDELVFFYNQCAAFVFPSLHEGFGLPPLEAMSCGRPVLSSGLTSLPEVIQREDVLFDPEKPQEIAVKLAQVLTDEQYSSVLVRHAQEQAKKFSWELTTQRALDAIKAKCVESKKTVLPGRRPRLALVSPLPPEHTGIADYSAELLPELSKYYDVVCIVEQKTVANSWALAHCTIHSPDWLRVHREKIDRILYHIGNSHFHSFMNALLQEIPGVVVLHDFFISNLFILENNEGVQLAWAKELYNIHGYHAVADYYSDPECAKMTYPVSGNIVDEALGVIVHSEHSRELADQWYGKGRSDVWKVIPLLRRESAERNQVRARKALGLDYGDYIIGSFGIMDSTKLNHVTLQAWLDSSLSKYQSTKLCFIGENFGSEYFQNMLAEVQKRKLNDRVIFTGRCEMETFRLYLEAVDIAVQLRTNSRGETSAAVLDCMNYGIPTIINACGSLAENDPESVVMLSEQFAISELTKKMEEMFADKTLSRKISENAKNTIKTVHSPERCGKLYYEAIESFYANPTAKSTSGFPKILLDITATQKNGLRTGIERVARALIKEMIAQRLPNYRIEPVYLSCEKQQWNYRFARQYTLDLLGLPPEILADDVVEFSSGDVIIGLDISDDIVRAYQDFPDFFAKIKKAGVKVYRVVYDLLPLKMPHFFPEGAAAFHLQWLQTLAMFDGLVAISKSVSDDLEQWLQENSIERSAHFKIFYSHLGADIRNSGPSFGLPDDFSAKMEAFAQRPTFLMVGTIEPRKGYLQVVQAFSKLWSQGSDINLVIVGSEGWKPVPEHMRRNIPEIINSITGNSELNKRLFWLEGISDEYLEKVYARSCCLIAASEGEGFGLPLIEAAQHGLPIIARDIPVFREVAGSFAYYFDNSNDWDVLCRAVTEWLKLFDEGEHPRSEGMSWLTWSESSRNLLACVGIRNK